MMSDGIDGLTDSSGHGPCRSLEAGRARLTRDGPVCTSSIVVDVAGEASRIFGSMSPASDAHQPLSRSIASGTLDAELGALLWLLVEARVPLRRRRRAIDRPIRGSAMPPRVSCLPERPRWCSTARARTSPGCPRRSSSAGDGRIVPPVGATGLRRARRCSSASSRTDRAARGANEPGLRSASCRSGTGCWRRRPGRGSRTCSRP